MNYVIYSKLVVKKTKEVLPVIDETEEKLANILEKGNDLLWKNGFIKLNKVDNIDNLGAYVTKYMTKDNIDSRLKGQKCYSMSKGLNAPEVVTDEEEVEEVLEELGDVIRVYSRTFESEYYGTVTYTQFVCRAPVKIPILRRYRVYEDDGVHPFAKVGV